jgi:hypothetical protein
MAQSIYWADSYVEKQRTAEAAIAMIRPGKRVLSAVPAVNRRRWSGHCRPLLSVSAGWRSSGS